MAHNIDTYIGRQSAWHGLGTVTGEYQTWTEILAHGGLDFEVIKDRLEHNRVLVNAWGMFRSDNGVFLGTVGEDYQPIQHALGFEMIDALVASKDGAHYETAGVLGAGETVWGLADLALTMRVGEDVQKGYLLFSTSHDGSMSHTYRTCLTRVVCQNTLNVALGERSKGLFKVRHTKNAVSRLTDAHKALQAIEADTLTIEAKLNFLASRKVTRESMQSIFDRLFPVAKKADGKDVDTTRRDNVLTAVLANYESNDRNTFVEQRGSAYNLLNAITEYTDHERSSRGDRRQESALFGSGDVLKSRAFEYVLEAANGMPMLQTETVYAPAPAFRKPVVSEVSTGSSILDDVLAGMGVA